MPDRRPGIAIAHAAFLGGGGEAVTLWGIQALARRYDVTLVTLLPLDIAAIDDFYGTSLGASRFQVIALLPPNAISRKIVSSPIMFTLRQQFLSWHMRRLESSYDLLVSTYNEMDLGRPGIQYIHAPLFSSYNSEARIALHYPDSIVRKAWKNLCGLTFGCSEKRLRENLAVTNSEWTASLLENVCKISSKVLYPPVWSSEVRTAWEDRRDAFLVVGRFVREKRVELAIEIVDRVRSAGFDVKLHIVGHVPDANYFKSLLKMKETRSSWLSFGKNVSRSELTELLQGYKYGIHAREGEQFGIGVAEMAASGCVPFVPAIGGQAEIVGKDTRLMFHDVDDAVDKIVRVIACTDTQRAVRKNLSQLTENFSAARFMDNFRLLIEEALSADVEARV
jgi:glycosyltransferase involved in cell wall biosynthesis